MDFLDWTILLLSGACVGSFLNVCIYRLPLGVSVIRPPSTCAACGLKIKWFDNVPIFSWFWLKGRARCCGSKIDGRYPLVETLTALGLIPIWWFHPAPIAIVYSLLFFGLVVATFIDIDLSIIPDEITLGGIALGILCSVFVPSIHDAQSLWLGLIYSVVGALAGGGLLWGVAILGKLVFKKEAMGMGDVKLMSAFGAFLGWASTFWILSIASLVGSAIGILLLLRKGKMWGVRIPFGPYLAIGAYVWMLGGKSWLMSYL